MPVKDIAAFTPPPFFQRYVCMPFRQNPVNFITWHQEQKKKVCYYYYYYTFRMCDCCFFSLSAA